MTTPKKTAKPTVFDDKVRQLLKNEMSTGTDLAANAWDLDRSTPMGTLKGLIRKVNTPDRALNLTLVHALVLRTDDNIKSFYETVKNEEAGVEYQMIRVMVLSDTRHYWIPEAKRSNDPAIGFYPMVKYVYGTGAPMLKPGDIVTVQFNNPRAQFSSHMETGKVISIEGHLTGKWDIDLGSTCRSILPDEEKQLPDPCEKVFRLGEVEPVGEEPTITPSGEKLLIPAPPVRNINVTSPFDLERFHPVRKRTEPHYGVDFTAPVGEVIFAALDGVVTLRTNRGGPTKGYGYYIFIKHTTYSTKEGGRPKPFFTLYAHLQSHLRYPVVKNGQKVKRGQPIGFSANSGTSSGPHLHFEYITNSSTPFAAGDKKDPMAFFIGNNFYQKKGA